MWCNDGNGCTDDTCDPASGCIFTPNTNSCIDGDACTFGDTCSGGVCSASAYSCDDGDPCTSDVCDGAGGCTHTPVPGCGACTAWSCPACPIPEICGNAIDDDCDGLTDVADTADCPCEVQECFSENCPPGYVCEPLGCCVLPS